MSEGNRKVETIMLLVNSYKNKPTTQNYNAVYEAIDHVLSRPPAAEAVVMALGHIDEDGEFTGEDLTPQGLQQMKGREGKLVFIPKEKI